MSRKIKPFFSIPADGDPDFLGEFGHACALLAPAFAAISRHEGAAAANVLFAGGPAPAFAVLVQALAVPLAEIAEGYLSFRARLDEHRHRPGARRGGEWQPVPDMVSSVRVLRNLFQSISREGDLALAAVEAEAVAAQRALAALDAGSAVFDRHGSLIPTSKEKLQ